MSQFDSAYPFRGASRRIRVWRDVIAVCAAFFAVTRFRPASTWARPCIQPLVPNTFTRSPVDAPRLVSSDASPTRLRLAAAAAAGPTPHPAGRRPAAPPSSSPPPSDGPRRELSESRFLLVGSHPMTVTSTASEQLFVLSDSLPKLSVAHAP